MILEQQSTDLRMRNMEVRMLIVDDYPAVREALRSVFRAAGVRQFREAATPDEAIRAVTEEAFDLVLLDISLRGKDADGLQVLHEVKLLNVSLPVLIHSHYDSPHWLARSFRLGSAGYVVKGLDTRVLVDAVLRAAAGGDAWTDEQLRQIKELDLSPQDSQYSGMPTS